MRLSERLMAIANFVSNNTIVADIGTDHGYIPAYLIENKISKKVIGTDISKGSLDKIIGYIKELGFEDQVDTRLGDGLEVIKPYEVDTVIIAGMGGLLIIEILEKHKAVSDSIIDFILQPMVAQKELRAYLLENSFEIIDEELVKEEDKYYEIIHARKGKASIEKEIYYEISPILIEKKHPLLKEAIENKLNAMNKILESMAGIDTDKAKERSMELNKIIADYKEVLEEIEG